MLISQLIHPRALREGVRVLTATVQHHQKRHAVAPADRDGNTESNRAVSRKPGAQRIGEAGGNPTEVKGARNARRAQDSATPRHLCETAGSQFRPCVPTTRRSFAWLRNLKAVTHGWRELPTARGYSEHTVSSAQRPQSRPSDGKMKAPRRRPSTPFNLKSCLRQSSSASAGSVVCRLNRGRTCHGSGSVFNTSKRAREVAPIPRRRLFFGCKRCATGRWEAAARGFASCDGAASSAMMHFTDSRRNSIFQILRSAVGSEGGGGAPCWPSNQTQAQKIGIQQPLERHPLRFEILEGRHE